jgi:hypothetical protein
MVRCPSCGGRFVRRRSYGGIVECPICRARLRTTGPGSIALVLGIFALVSIQIFLFAFPMWFGSYFLLLLIFICLIPVLSSRVEVAQPGSSESTGGSLSRQGEALSQGVPQRQISVDRQPNVGQNSRSWGYCIYCGAAVRSAESRFCTNCGASLPPQTAEPQQQVGDQRIESIRITGNCMVCSLRVSPDEPIAYCPHCGNVAHKVHLLQWLYLHKECPACRQHLSEQEMGTNQR